MISQLTSEQETNSQLCARKWKKITHYTDPANQDEAECAIYLAYEALNLPPPKYYLVQISSPDV
jgi:hypothetical protein